MFVQRMVNDPEFRERVLTEKRGKDEMGCEVTAQDWEQVLEGLLDSPNLPS